MASRCRCAARLVRCAHRWSWRLALGGDARRCGGAAAATRHMVWTCAVIVALAAAGAAGDRCPTGRSCRCRRAAALRIGCSQPVPARRQRPATRRDDVTTAGRSAPSPSPVRAAPMPLDSVCAEAPSARRPLLPCGVGVRRDGGARLHAARRRRVVAHPPRGGGRRAAGDEARELAEAMAIAAPIAVVESAATSMPLVCGVWRPRIVLPARRRASGPTSGATSSSLHELAHIKRRDCLTQAIAQVVCALYWFNPLAWIAARRLRVERERACDDFVLAAGIRGSDYANHLLGIAQAAAASGCRRWRRQRSRWPGVHNWRDVSWLFSILQSDDRRARHAQLGAAIVIGLALPIAALQPQAAAVVPREAACGVPARPGRLPQRPRATSAHRR